jgi:hypothetical protein
VTADQRAVRLEHLHSMAQLNVFSGIHRFL